MAKPLKKSKDAASIERLRDKVDTAEEAMSTRLSARSAVLKIQAETKCSKASAYRYMKAARKRWALETEGYANADRQTKRRLLIEHWCHLHELALAKTKWNPDTEAHEPDPDLKTADRILSRLSDLHALGELPPTTGEAGRVQVQVINVTQERLDQVTDELSLPAGEIIDGQAQDE